MNLAKVVLPWQMVALITVVLALVHLFQYVAISESQTYQVLKTEQCTVENVRISTDDTHVVLQCGDTTVETHNLDNMVGALQGDSPAECSLLEGQTFGDREWWCGDARKLKGVEGDE